MVKIRVLIKRPGGTEPQDAVPADGLVPVADRGAEVPRKVVAEATGVGGGFRELSPGQPVRRKLVEVAKELGDALGVVAGALESLTPRAPDTIVVETSVEIGTGGAIKLFGADVKGGLKVTLTWSAKSAATGASKDSAAGT